MRGLLYSVLHPATKGTRLRRASRHCRLELLEERTLLSISVTRADDPTPIPIGTLRWAIQQANSVAGHDEIVIKDQSSGVQWINLQSELPTITEGVTIRTESGNWVVVDGQNYWSNPNGRGFLVQVNSGTQSVTFEDICMIRVRGDAFEVNGGGLTSVTFDGCSAQFGVTGIGFHLGAPNADRIAVNNCVIYMKQWGIWSTSDVGFPDGTEPPGQEKGLYITNNQISSSGLEPPSSTFDAIRCDDGSGFACIQGNVIYDVAGRGIYLNGQSTTDLQVAVIGNTIDYDVEGYPRTIGAEGILIKNWRGLIDPGDNSDMSFLYQNTIANTNGPGISVSGSQQVSIAGNDVSYSAEDGILVAGWPPEWACYDISILGNIVHDNVGHGIAMCTDETGGTVSDIDIAPLVVPLGGGYYAVYPSQIRDNSGSGISVGGFNVHDVYIGPDQTTGLGQNYITGNGEFGVDLCNCHNIDVNYNYIGTNENAEDLGNAAGGIHLVAAGDNDIEGNFIAYNGASGTGWGIEIEGTGWTPLCDWLSQNYYLANEQGAIKITDGAQDILGPPEIVTEDIVQTATDWTVPVAIDAGVDFASKAFTFEFYLYDPTAEEYIYSKSATDTLDANGIGDASAVFTTSEVPVGWQLTVLALCDDTPTNGTVAGTSSEFASAVDPRAPRLADRHVFYNNSWLDGNNAGANANDDNAVDADVVPWVVSDQYDSAHNRYTTGYSKGINGVMVDIANLANPTGLSADDFLFEYVVNGDWTTWSEGPSDIAVRSGEGTNGSDRITLAWDATSGHNAVVANWLRVTVLANADTGLQDPDVFCFGNLPGDANGDRTVGAGDLDILRANWGQSAKWVDQGDINLDNTVGAGDLDILRSRWGQSLADPPGAGQQMRAGGDEDLYTGSWSQEVDEIFFRYGFGDNDPTNDVAPGDELWNQFVDELFTTIEVVLDQQFAEAV